MIGKWTHRALEEIRRLRYELQRGWVTAVDAKAHHGQGYLSRVLSGKIQRLDVETLFCIMEHPLVDARELLRRIGFDLSAPNPVHYLGRIPQLKPADPLLVKLEEAVQAWSLGAHVTREEPVDRGSVEALLSELRAIDELRFSDSPSAWQRLVDLTSSRAWVDAPEVVIQALGVYGSIKRVQGRLGSAARALRLALEHGGDSPAVRASLLQRVAYLVAHRGWWAAAAELAQQAINAYVLADDRRGIGESLVDRAMMLVYLQRLDEGRQAYLSSLRYLPASARRNRTAALHGLGWIHLQTGQLETAQELLHKAIELLSEQSGSNWAKLVWLQGEIYLKQQNLAAAEEALRQSSAAFSDREDPVDLATVQLQLAEVLMLRGRTVEVYDLAKDMIRLLTPFNNHRLAGALILEFVNAAEKRQITLALVERIRREFQKMQGTASAYPAQER